jgi:hypothetical protein
MLCEMEFLLLNFCDSKNLGVFPTPEVTSQPLGRVVTFSLIKRPFLDTL